jgi:hypothetical protein
MFVALFFVDVPQQPYQVEPYEGANQALSERLL